MTAHHIDEVIRNLEHIIAITRREGNRLGYFPALYRKVTLEVAKGIQQGRFDDGERMERLDVIFANRYLDAIEAHQRGGVPARCWRIAFDAAHDWWPIVLQHLLLGINAHINLDLGIAAATTCPDSSLPALKEDFDRINEILASLVDGVKGDLTAVWPMLSLLDRVSGSIDDAVINFSMAKARNSAWNVAQTLAAKPASQWPALISQLDDRVAFLARRVRHPGWLQGTVLRAIRIGERGSVSEVIDLLC